MCRLQGDIGLCNTSMRPLLALVSPLHSHGCHARTTRMCMDVTEPAYQQSRQHCALSRVLIGPCSKFISAKPHCMAARTDCTPRHTYHTLPTASISFSDQPSCYCHSTFTILRTAPSPLSQDCSLSCALTPSTVPDVVFTGPALRPADSVRKHMWRESVVCKDTLWSICCAPFAVQD